MSDNASLPNPEDLMTSSQVAELFNVDIKTVIRWGNQGKLRMGKTPGGRKRFYRPEVESYLRSFYNAQGG